MYGEGENAKREAYIAKLAELKKIGDPVFKRKREDEDRPHAVASLKAAIEYYQGLADSTVSSPFPFFVGAHQCSWSIKGRSCNGRLSLIMEQIGPRIPLVHSSRSVDYNGQPN